MYLRAVQHWWACLWSLFFMLVLWMPAPTWAEDHGTSVKITDALKDGTGTVWGIDGSGHDLYALDANARWKRATPSGMGPEMKPFCLGRRHTDGAVFCLWQTDDTNCQCSVHQGNSSKVFEPFYLSQQPTIRPTRLTGDSKGNMWVTRASPNIYRMTADGDAELVRTVLSAECLPNTVIGYGAYDPWEPVSMSEDASCRLWFWTVHPNGTNTFGGVIRGTLLYDGPQFVRDDPFVRHDLLEPTLQYQKGITLLAQKDAQHLWFGLNGDGLYTLDTTTNRSERVPGQPGDSYYTSLVAKSASGDWLFVMGNGRTLWRLTADGKWNRLIDNLDMRYDSHGQQDRMWANDERGDYIGSNGKGVWFIPRDGSAPRLLGWEQGFPLATPRRFVDLSGGRWLGVGADGQTWVGSPATLTSEAAPPARKKIQTMTVVTPFRTDARGHLWTTLTDRPTKLCEWDGDRWIEHHLPDELGVAPSVVVFNLDVRGRPWLNFWGENNQTAIYDPASNYWQVFESFKKALEAQDGKHDAELVIVPNMNCCDLSRFGPEGRICYMGGAFLVNYFDGHQWRSWNEEQIKGRLQGSYGGPPFFNHAGRVSINIGKQTMEYADDGGWRVTDYEPGFAQWSQFVMGANWTTTPDFKLPFQPEHMASDNQGAWWLLHDNTLYKACNGLCVPVFAPGEPQPFADGRSLGCAFVDPKGHAFLRSDNNIDRNTNGQVVTLASPGPPPHTTLAQESVPRESVTNAPSDRIIIRLTTNAGLVEGKTRFSWRLDGGPWTALAVDGPASTMTLDGLPNGTHRFEARSFDTALQTDVMPVVLSFEVRVDPQAQIAGYIAQLSHPDYSRRNAAIAALARQPALALPALQQARSHADEDHRWWIDAALQKIETMKRTAGPKPDAIHLDASQ